MAEYTEPADFAPGATVQLPTTIVEGDPQHDEKHNTERMQLNWLTQQWANRPRPGARRANPLLGGTDLIVGGNVIPTPDQVDEHAPIGWPLLWQGVHLEDGVSFEWIKAQVDALRGPDCRGNAIRIIGSVGGVIGGFYTRAEYHAAIGKVIDYCRSVGVSVYFAMSYWADFNGGLLPDTDEDGLDPAVPTADHIAELVACAQYLRDTGNVIAIDVIQEFKADGLELDNFPNDFPGLVEIVTDIIEAIRAAGVETPLTCSQAIFNTAGWALWTAGTENVFDFIGLHLYYGGTGGVISSPPPLPAPTHPPQLYTVIPDGMPVVIGEAGVSTIYTDADRLLMYNAVGTLLPGSRIVACFAWAIGDQSTASAANKWGLFSGLPGTAMVARNVAAAVRAWPRRRTLPSCSKSLSADLAVTANTMTSIPFLLTNHDHGGLGGGSGTQPWTVPNGMGGLYRVDVSVGWTAGGYAGAFDLNVNKADGVTSLAEIQHTYAAAESGTKQTSVVVDLADGEGLVPKVYSTQAITLTKGPTPTRTYISLTKLP